MASAISQSIMFGIDVMIRFRDKPKDKAANTNTSAKDVAHSTATTAPAAKETEDAIGPRPKADPAKSKDVKQ